MKSIFACPVCKEPLEKNEKSYACPNGHSFDISAKGYVNLLLGNAGGGHGDNKLMLNARRAFLQKGYYRILADFVSALLLENIHICGTLLDIGCGEGYYTECFQEALRKKFVTVIGTDISKEALSLANGKRSGLAYAVASNAKLPFPSASVDIVTALFTPLSEEESARVLKQNGLLIQVTPAKDHLMGLKRALYAVPYQNDLTNFVEGFFDLVKTEQILSEITLYGEDIQNLFQMTPYYYKTSAEAQKALLALPSLTTEISFIIKTYRVRKNTAIVEP